MKLKNTSFGYANILISLGLGIHVMWFLDSKEYQLEGCAIGDSLHWKVEFHMYHGIGLEMIHPWKIINEYILNNS